MYLGNLNNQPEAFHRNSLCNSCGQYLFKILHKNTVLYEEYWKYTCVI